MRRYLPLLLLLLSSVAWASGPPVTGTLGYHLQPVNFQFTWSTGTIYANACNPGPCTDPDTGITANTCGGRGTVSAACATAAGDWSPVTVYALNPSHPLIVNSMRCFYPDTNTITGAGVNDKIDVSLQVDGTSTNDGTWTPLSSAVGTTGGGRVTFTSVETADNTDYVAGWTGAVVVPAGSAYGLRAVAMVGVDADASISTGAGTFVAMCFVRGWN